MNISGSSRSTPNLKNEISSSSNSSGAIGSRNDATTLSFYAEPPYFELSLDEFEEFALARLKVGSLMDIHFVVLFIYMNECLLFHRRIISNSLLTYSTALPTL
jgi:hypothetical protein